MGIPFWYQYVYDGTWLLDGSVILNTKRRYGLALGMWFGQGGFYTKEQARLVLVGFKGRIENDEIFRAGVSSHFGINFWGVRCFDGLWNLDGSVLLDARRRYGLILNMGNGFGVRNKTEGVKLQNLSTAWKQHIRENVRAEVVYHDAVDFWGLLYLDGGWNLDGEHLLNFSRCRAKAALTVRSEVDLSGQETVGIATVETKTRDYWFLNGALSLDGTRNLNSIYRKEVAE